MRLIPILFVLAALAACGSDTADPLTEAGTAPAEVEVDTPDTLPTAVDPYETYLELSADIPEAAEIQLSREDAQARAMLGCGIDYAPGTIDAALQQAYVIQVEQLKAQGVCSPAVVD